MKLSRNCPCVFSTGTLTQTVPVYFGVIRGQAYLVMSKKRGLSLEEKRERLLAGFHDSEDVFVLKEVEKMGVSKGVTIQSVKDVLQSLVDDDLVHQERIGASNYFWAFPSEEAVRLEMELQELQKRKEGLEVRLEEVGGELVKAKIGKEGGKERQEAMEALGELQARAVELEKEVSQFRDNDPEVIAAMKDACGVAKDAANR